MSDQIRVLHVGTEEDVVARERDVLAQIATFAEVDHAVGFVAGLERMAFRRYDAYLVASRLGPKTGIDFLRAYREAGGVGPVIVIADSDDPAEDALALEAGAAGYLVRERLHPLSLERSIRYAVEASRRAAALRRVRDELEARVAERTEALETMNEALAAEVAERRAAERALREEDRRKDAFFATLAHELRNPLAPLSFATEILSRRGDAKEDGSGRVRALRVIERQVAHMVRLIDDLLDLSRSTHGKLDLRREWVSLAAVIESALETAGPHLVHRRHVFELIVPPAPVLLHADPMRLAQVLSNVLTNAAKFTEPGGQVRLEAVRDGDHVVVSVVDSGIGIPAAHLGHVFTMFGQGHRAHEAVYGGLGIGLALAKNLTELHGGSLSVASEGEGRGSVFTLRLACAPENVTLPAAAQPLLDAPATPLRILVVDDNVEAALTLAELLTLDGHETHVGHDGPAAVDAAKRLSPDVAILDIGLPGFDGLEAARRIRADPSLGNILLIALSGWVQPDDQARSRAAGFDYHLAKPIQLRSLELVLRESRGGRDRSA